MTAQRPTLNAQREGTHASNWAGRALPLHDGQIPCRQDQYSAGRGTACRAQPRADGQVELLSLPWTLFYFAAAMAISFFYYHNPGWWKLLEHTRYWLNWIYSFL